LVRNKKAAAAAAAAADTLFFENSFFNPLSLKFSQGVHRSIPILGQHPGSKVESPTRNKQHNQVQYISSQQQKNKHS